MATDLHWLIAHWKKYIQFAGLVFKEIKDNWFIFYSFEKNKPRASNLPAYFLHLRAWDKWPKEDMWSKWQDMLSFLCKSFFCVCVDGILLRTEFVEFGSYVTAFDHSKKLFEACCARNLDRNCFYCQFDSEKLSFYLLLVSISNIRTEW